jgi:hypothetical protein
VGSRQGGRGQSCRIGLSRCLDRCQSGGYIFNRASCIVAEKRYVPASMKENVMHVPVTALTMMLSDMVVSFCRRNREIGYR